MGENNKKPSIRLLGTIISWAITAFFVLMALAIPGVIAKILFLICAILPCPIFRKHVTIPKKTWIPAIAILLVAACVVSPTAKSSADDSAVQTPAIAEEVVPPDPADTTQEEIAEQEAPIQEDGPADAEKPAEGRQPAETEELPADPAEPAQEEQAADAEVPAQQEQPETVETVDVPEESEEIIVYITDTGTKYHRGTCRHLKDSKVEIPLEKAKTQGYEPCGTCNPPV